jgi:heme exporter protein D
MDTNALEAAARHAPFIWASYGAVTLVVAGLLAWLWLDARRQRGALADLERRGVRRRSARSE